MNKIFVVFCSHAAFSVCFLLFFFSIFCGDVFLNGFPNQVIVHSISCLLFSR